MEHRGADAAWPVAQHSRLRARPAPPLPPARAPAPAVRGARLRLQPRQGAGGPALRPRRPPERLSCTCPARAGRPGRVVGRYAQGRPGPAGVRPDGGGPARPSGVDGGHQAGAGLPGPRAPPLRGDRHGRRRAGRGRGRLGRGDGPSLVARVVDVAHRAAPPRHPARSAGQAPARGGVRRARRRRPCPWPSRAGRPRARFAVVPDRSVDPDRGPLDRRTDHLRRGRRDRDDRGRGPRRRGAARDRRRPRTSRSRSTEPALRQRPLRRRAPPPDRRPPPSGRRPRPPGLRARSAPPTGSTSTARSPSTAPPAPSRARSTSCLPSPGKLVVSGEQVFDIRDFDIASPTVLMLRIYPDVLVQLQVEAEPMRPAGSRSDGDPPGVRRGLRVRAPAPAARTSTTSCRPLQRHPRVRRVPRPASAACAPMPRTACASWPPCSTGRTPTVGRCPASSTQDLVERVKSLVGRSDRRPSVRSWPMPRSPTTTPGRAERRLGPQVDPPLARRPARTIRYSCSKGRPDRTAASIASPHAVTIVGVGAAEVGVERAGELQRVDAVDAVQLVAPLHRAGPDVPQPPARRGPAPRRPAAGPRPRPGWPAPAASR